MTYLHRLFFTLLPCLPAGDDLLAKVVFHPVALPPGGDDLLAEVVFHPVALCTLAVDLPPLGPLLPTGLIFTLKKKPKRHKYL
jgi:hypothetical protein